MNSKEFLKWDRDDEVNWVELINRDCQPYLNANRSANLFALFRGMRNIHEPFVKKQTRLDGRVPKDTPQELHNWINKYFTKTFGAPFRDSMFCSGSMEHADEYGIPYIIFPIGKFEFLWAPTITDLFRVWAINKKKYDANINTFMQMHIVNNYTTKDINKAIYSGNEIMLRCDSYYAINPILWNEIMDEFK